MCGAFKHSHGRDGQERCAAQNRSIPRFLGTRRLCFGGPRLSKKLRLPEPELFLQKGGTVVKAHLQGNRTDLHIRNGEDCMPAVPACKLILIGDKGGRSGVSDTFG